MRINSQRRLAERHGSDHIGCFPPNSRNGHQLINLLGQASAEIIYDLPRCMDQVCGLVVRIRARPDQSEYRFNGGCRQTFHSGKTLIERGRDHVHPLVRALGGKNDGNHQLVGIGVFQLGFGNRHVLAEPPDHAAEPFFGGHSGLLPGKK
jgi:hypothetical protein